MTIEKLTAQVLKGKQLFYDARDFRLASDGYLSCASCHNDGGHDGRVWDLTGFGEGIRNTIDLRGRSGTGHGLLHWTANFDEVQDFEGQIRSLAGGTGLMTDASFAATQDTLGAPKAGLSADLDALAAYVSSLATFQNSPYRNADGSLTADATAGKSLFTSAGCTQCHGGSSFTDSPSRLLHNVGTIKPASGQRLNATLNGIDAPTLRDAWKTAPYLHDGSALTLQDAIRQHNTGTLSESQIAQLASYIQQIGGNEPAAVNQPATVAITSPSNATTFMQGSNISIAANAVDSDGSVIKVEFYVGNTLLGTDNTAPYNFNWSDAAPGSYVLTVKAYDNYGIATTSAGVSITVQSVVRQGLPNLVNLAQNKAATQSSTAYDGAPTRAVDGNTNGNWSGSSLTHTDYQSNAWWQVDLGAVANLAQITLWNRTDCCAERLSNFYLFVSTTDMAGRSYSDLLNDSSVWRQHTPGQAPTQLTIPAAVNGRYVRVQLAGGNYLSLAEVQVWESLSPWERLPGTLQQVSVNSTGQAVAVNGAGVIYQWQNGAWVQLNGTLKQVSISADGAIWGVNSSDRIYRRDGATWTQIPGALRQVSAARNGRAIGVNSAENIWSWNGAWTQIPGTLRQVSAGPNNTAWGVNTHNNIWYWNGSWTQIPGAMSQVAVGDDGTVWALGVDQSIHTWNGSSWVKNPGSFVSLSVGNANTIWAVDASGAVWRWRGAAN